MKPHFWEEETGVIGLPLKPESITLRPKKEPKAEEDAAACRYEQQLLAPPKAGSRRRKPVAKNCRQTGQQAPRKVVLIR